MMTHRPRKPRYEDEYEYDDRPRRREKQSMFSGITNQLDRIPLEWLLGIGSVAMMTSACIGHSVINYTAAVLWMTFCGTFLVLKDKSIDSRETNINKFVRKYGKVGICSIIFGVFALTTLSLVMADPSYAIFMDKAQTYAEDTFTTGTPTPPNGPAIKSLIGFIFGALRLFIIIALAVGIYKIIAARDDSEDMKAQARLPIIVLISVAAFDVMSAFIIPVPAP